MIAGIDYSMSNPAITIKDGDTFYFYSIEKTKKVQGVFKSDNVVMEVEPSLNKQDYDTDIERYDAISDWAIDKLLKHKVTNVILEGYSYGSSIGLAFNIAENTALLKIKLTKHNIDYVTVAPTELKKWFTTYGNATKEMMVDKFIETTGIKLHEMLGDDKPYRNPINDIVDSYALWRKGSEE